MENGPHVTLKKKLCDQFNVCESQAQKTKLNKEVKTTGCYQNINVELNTQ